MPEAEHGAFHIHSERSTTELHPFAESPIHLTLQIYQHMKPYFL